MLTSDEIYESVKRAVEKAEESLKIASAWIKGRYFEEILERAKEKGLNLEVVLRASEFQDMIITDERVFRKIREVEGKVYLSERLHAKFLIADRCVAVVGSANFTESGLSEFSQGNIEAGVLYEAPEGAEEIGKLLEYFERIKGESVQFGEDLLGFTINPVKSRSFEFVLVDESVAERSYVEVRLEEHKVLGRVNSVYAYDMGFFANPFSSRESMVFAPIQDFKKIFSEDKDKEWKKAAVLAYLNGNGNRLRIATAEVVGSVKDGRLEVVREPFHVGTPVHRASADTLKELMNRKFSGEPMKHQIRVGRLKDSEIEASVAGEEVVTKHMLVVGTTGSGKSYFVKSFLCALLDSSLEVQVFILDPHGEYWKGLSSKCQRVKEKIEHIELQDTLFPLELGEVADLLKYAGHGSLLDGRSNKENVAKVSKAVKPSLKLTGFKDKNLKDLLLELKDGEEALHSLKEILGSEGPLSNQKEVCDLILKGLSSSKKAVIFDFSEITDPQTRVNLAGLIMQELFLESKKDKKGRLVVLEEAHNFAPEKGYGDVSSGRDNLALTMAKKIASEGRKFRLGLVTVTQRPAQVSKFVLSQMNTQAMFRTMNRNDLDAVSTYVEYAGEDTIGTLPFLPTGTCILSGAGVPFPMIVEVS